MLKRFKYILIMLFLVVFFVSCSGSDSAVSAVNLPQITQGIITFTTGDVQKLQNNEWTEADINDFLEKGDTVKVETDSFCEIQFGNRAVIKVEENTELVIPTLNTGSGNADISVKMITGSVLSKVSKLTGSESFSVNTKTAACGVRGTQFMVKADGDETLLAVKEGSVALVPSSFNLKKLMEKIPSGKGDIYISLKKIEDSLTIVSTNEEFFITAEDMAIIEKLYSDLEKAVVKIEDEGADESTEKEIKLLSEILIKELAATASLTQIHKDEMDYLDSMLIRDLPKGDDVTDKLVKVSVNVNLTHAQIIKGGQIIGRGGFSAIFNDGEEVSLFIRERGYFEKTLSFTAQKNTENKYDVILEKDPDAKEYAEITINTVPEDAEIIIDGVSEGSGSVVRELLSKNTYQVIVKKEGFQKKYLSISEPKENEIVEITLLPSVERRIKVSNGTLTGSTVFADNVIYTADSYGEVAASDPGGSILWKQQTGNTPNERAYPVIYNNNVYFSGANEFITFDAVSGGMRNSVFLEDDESHVFGRRVVFTGTTGIYPANSSLIKFTPETGEFNDQIEIPGGTRMTPGLYNNELLVVSQKGVFYRIDSVTGGIKSSLQTEAVQPVVNNVVVFNEKAYFNGRKGEIVCIDLPSNTIKWSKSLVPGKTTMITGDIQCSADAVFAYSGGRIYIVSAETGKKIGSSISGVSSPPVIAVNRLFYGTNGGLFVTADTETGKTLETININAKITSSPAYSGGKVFAGTSRGEVLVLNP